MERQKEQAKKEVSSSCLLGVTAPVKGLLLLSKDSLGDEARKKEKNRKTWGISPAVSSRNSLFHSVSEASPIPACLHHYTHTWFSGLPWDYPGDNKSFLLFLIKKEQQQQQNSSKFTASGGALNICFLLWSAYCYLLLRVLQSVDNDAVQVSLLSSMGDAGAHVFTPSYPRTGTLVLIFIFKNVGKPPDRLCLNSGSPLLLLCWFWLILTSRRPSDSLMAHLSLFLKNF